MADKARARTRRWRRCGTRSCRGAVGGVPGRERRRRRSRSISRPRRSAHAPPDPREGRSALDGRGLDDIRDIIGEVGLLPRAHGSALFTRGQTQALGVVTLGTVRDEQRDRHDRHAAGDVRSRSCCTTTSRRSRSGRRGRSAARPRREQGHGHWRSGPSSRCCPRTTTSPTRSGWCRDVLESNGSTSMASVCGGFALAHGRGRADAGAVRRRGHGPDQGGRQGRGPDRHPGRRGRPRRHGLQGGRHAGRASRRSRWTSRSRG